jgi:hypothetical protein
VGRAHDITRIDSMNVNDIFPTRFVAAADLNGKSFTLTIRSVTLEDMQSHDNKTVTKPVAWFTNAAKGLVLNRTNTMIIADLYGPETDDWAGKQIIIYATKVRAFGKMEDAIRVREEVPLAKAAPTPAQDDEDADFDEGALPTTDASIFDNGTPSTKSPDDASAAQLLRLTKLMAQLYGADWGQLEPKLAQDASTGSVSQFSELKVKEAQVLIGKLEAGIKQAANGKVIA